MNDNDIEVIEDNDEAGYDETGFEGEESILEADEEEAKIDNDEIEDNPTRTFQIYHGRIRNKFDELPAMEQAVDKILQTERFIYPIYTDQYGNDLPDLIGEDINYAIVEVERMIVEALMDDDRVIDVEIDTIEPTSSDAIYVKGICHTVYGNVPIDEEVNLEVES